MMVPITVIILLFWTHFIADFFLQSHYMSINKSKNSWVLLLHCAVYSLPFIWLGIPFALLAGAFHFPVDFITSRITSKLYKNEKYHWFFVVIGADQAIHMTALVLTFKWLM